MSGGNIFDEGQDEDTEALAEACQRLRSADAKDQLAAALKISEVLQSQIAAYPLEVELPALPNADARRLEALRLVWSTAFADSTPPAASAHAPDAMAENELSRALELGEVSLDGASDIIRALRAAGALPAGVPLALCDLRAGSAKLLTAASLLHPFSHAAGLEPASEKVEEAHAVLERLRILETSAPLAVFDQSGVDQSWAGLGAVVVEERDVVAEDGLLVERDGSLPTLEANR